MCYCTTDLRVLVLLSLATHIFHPQLLPESDRVNNAFHFRSASSCAEREALLSPVILSFFTEWSCTANLHVDISTYILEGRLSSYPLGLFPILSSQFISLAARKMKIISVEVHALRLECTLLETWPSVMSQGLLFFQIFQKHHTSENLPSKQNMRRLQTKC